MFIDDVLLFRAGLGGSKSCCKLLIQSCEDRRDEEEEEEEKKTRYPARCSMVQEVWKRRRWVPLVGSSDTCSSRR